MPSKREYKESRILGLTSFFVTWLCYRFSREDVFRVVYEIENYKEFVPWCVETKRVNHEMRPKADDEQLLCEYWEMKIGFHAINESFVSKVSWVLPSLIRVWYILWHHLLLQAEAIDSRIFKQMISTWEFEDRPEGCLVTYMVVFEFQNSLYAFLANTFFEDVSKRMITAFASRCEVCCKPCFQTNVSLKTLTWDKSFFLLYFTWTIALIRRTMEGCPKSGAEAAAY